MFFKIWCCVEKDVVVYFSLIIMLFLSIYSRGIHVFAYFLDKLNFFHIDRHFLREKTIWYPLFGSLTFLILDIFIFEIYILLQCFWWVLKKSRWPFCIEKILHCSAIFHEITVIFFLELWKLLPFVSLRWIRMFG